MIGRTRKGLAAFLLSACMAGGGCIGFIGDGSAHDDSVLTVEGSNSSQCHDQIGAWVPLRRITKLEYMNTVRDLLDVVLPPDAVPDDEARNGFYDNGLQAITEGVIADYMATAEGLALQATVDVVQLAGCDPTNGTEEADCAKSFIASFGRRAWRRPLDEEEQQQILNLYETGTGFGDGLRLVVQAMLQSPHFLYHVELGGSSLGESGEIVLTPYELASRLSYLLWKSMPDDELFDAAESGALSQSETLVAQAERLLDHPRARASMGSFHRQWFLMESDLPLPSQLQKDPSQFPMYDGQLGADMVRETEAFADYVVRHGDAKLATLLTAPWSFVNESLAAHYGVDIAADAIALDYPGMPDGYAAVAMPAGERAGILTHASVLATTAKSDNTSIPRRGLLLAERLLCVHIPPPPVSVNAEQPKPDPDSSVREQLTQMTSGQPCSNCHGVLNPLGFTFEGYDAVGAFRTVDEAGNPIDATGSLPSGDVDGDYDGLVEVVQALADSDQAHACFATAWYRYAFGGETDRDSCTLHHLSADFAKSGNIRDLLLALVRSPAFRNRRATKEGD